MFGACSGPGAESDPGRVATTSTPAPEQPQDEPDHLQRVYDQELSSDRAREFATTASDEQVFALDPRTECARLQVPLD